MGRCEEFSSAQCVSGTANIGRVMYAYKSNEQQLNNFYYYNSSSEAKMRNAYIISIEKPQKNEPLRRTRHRWEENIAINLKQQ
jgi:hypothetical protein